LYPHGYKKEEEEETISVMKEPQGNLKSTADAKP
jgi:hypothetical protein